MSSEILIGMLGGLIGGVLGVIGTLVSSYYGPRKMEAWREQRNEERINGPRKSLLLTLLKDLKYKDGRTLETLSRVTGTTDEECRRLLIEIKARGVKLEGNEEGWALIARNPIKEK
jgi:hypothetical protein